MAVAKEAIDSQPDPINYQLVDVDKAQSKIKVEEYEQLKRIDADAALSEQLNTIQVLMVE